MSEFNRPNTASGQEFNRPIIQKGEKQSQLKQELSAFESAAFNFGFRMIPDANVRTEYNIRAKKLSAEILQQVESGRVSVADGAKKASELRNQVMDAMRGKSSEIGEAYARAKKATGKTLQQLEEYYSAEKFKTTFQKLTKNQKEIVWKEIVFSSGRPNAKFNRLAKTLGIAGKSFLAITITVAAYNILTAEDKTKATAREGAVLGGGLLGSVAGGAAAGLACGPGAPVCVAIGVFVGGVLFAVGSEIAFDSFW